MSESPRERADIAEMADDYGRLLIPDFNAKWGRDWYERHGERLRAEFERRQRAADAIAEALG